MKLSLTNMTNEPESVADPAGTWADALNPNTPLDVDNDLGVLIIGDKPDVREQLEQAGKTVGVLVMHLLTLIRGRKQHAQATNKPEQVSTTILNRGAQAVRVILGNGTTDTTIAPGGSQLCSAAGYLELRELGGSPEQGGTPA